MPESGTYRDVILFVTLYILLSLPAFLYFNRDIVDEVRERIAPLDVVTMAVVGTAVFVLISALLLANEGVDRYNQFLFAPTDVLSVLIELSFVLAAVSWWIVPELAERFDWGPGFDVMLLLILVSQLPMVLFLSLMTAVGKA